MKAKIVASISGLLISLITPLAVLIPQVSAAVKTWDGEGSDNNWSTAENWSGDTVPVDGDSITFDFSDLTQDETLNNDLTNLELDGIHVTGAAPSSLAYIINGNEITLTGDLSGNSTQGRLFLQNDITLGANVTYSDADSSILLGTSGSSNELNLSTYDLTFDTESDDCVYTDVRAALNGSGNIVTTSGSSAVNFRTASAGFSGDVTVNGQGAAIFPEAIENSNTITVNGSGTLVLVSTSNTTFDINLVMNSDNNPSLIAGQMGFACMGGGGTKSTTKISGSLTLSRDTIFSGDNNLVIEGAYTSNSHALTVKSGSAGTLTTSQGTIEVQPSKETIGKNDKSSASVTAHNKQTIVMNGERDSAYVYEGGILKGTGVFTGNVNVSDGGTLAPGESPGCLTMGGLSISGNFDVEIAGKTECTEYDQAVVNGTVNLAPSGSATLNVTFLNDFKPAVNDAFMIIKNDGSDAVTGTFEGLADGATFQVAGYTLQINYNAGDGNDVMLLVTTIPTTPDTGIGNILANPLVTLALAFATIGVIGGLKFADFRKK